MKLSSLFLAVLFTLGVDFPVQADELLFDENFDDVPYADNQPLPEWKDNNNVGVVGRWLVTATPDRGMALTVPEQSVSAPRSLRLNVTESPDPMEAGVTVCGTFADNKTKIIAVPEAITLTLAFRIEDPEWRRKGALQVEIMGSYLTPDQKPRMPAQLRINSKGEPFVEVNFGGKWTKIPEPIEYGKWHRLEITLPSNPANAEAEYTVRLSDVDGKTDLGSVSGPLAAPSETDMYGYFFIHNSMPGTPVYIDDVLAIRGES